MLLCQAAMLAIPSISMKHTFIFKGQGSTTEDEGGKFLKNVGISKPTALNYPKEMHVV